MDASLNVGSVEGVDDIDVSESATVVGLVVVVGDDDDFRLNFLHYHFPLFSDKSDDHPEDYCRSVLTDLPGRGGFNLQKVALTFWLTLEGLRKKGQLVVRRQDSNGSDIHPKY